MKIRSKLFLHLIVYMYCMLFASSCDEVECPLNNTVSSSYGFYAMENNTEQIVALLDTLTVTVAGTDSILINKEDKANGMQIPMSYLSETDTLILEYISETNIRNVDTIWVSKTNYEHYESPSCPTAMFHKIIAIKSTHTYIDTIIVENPNVNYNGTENFKIYFHNAN